MSISLNRWAAEQNKFIPDLEVEGQEENDVPFETVWTVDDFVNFPDKLFVENIVLEPRGSSWSDGFGEFQQEGVGITAKKDAYLALAWLTLAAIFKNKQICCDVQNPKSKIKSILVGDKTPWNIGYGKPITLRSLEYMAEFPFRQEHESNRVIYPHDYPFFRLGCIDNEFPLSIPTSDKDWPFDCLAGFGSLQGHLFMAEYFLDMSRPSFEHPSHQNYLFESEVGYVRTAPTSHIACFQSNDLTRAFPEDVNPSAKLDGLFTNHNN